MTTVRAAADGFVAGRIAGRGEGERPIERPRIDEDATGVDPVALPAEEIEAKLGGGGEPAPPVDEANDDRREGGFMEPDIDATEGVLGVEVLGVKGPN